MKLVRRIAPVENFSTERCFLSSFLHSPVDVDSQINQLLQLFRNLPRGQLVFEFAGEIPKTEVHLSLIWPAGGGSQNLELHRVIRDTAGSLSEME